MITEADDEDGWINTEADRTTGSFPISLCIRQMNAF